MSVKYSALPEVLQGLGYTVQEMAGELHAKRGETTLMYVENAEGEAIGIMPSEVRDALAEQGYGSFKPSDAAPTGTEGTGSDKFKVKTGAQAQSGDLSGSSKVDTKGKELPPEYRSHGKNNEDPKHPSTKSGGQGPKVGSYDAGGGKDAGPDTSDAGRSSDGIKVADIYPPNEPGSDYAGTKVGSVSGVNTGPGRGGGKAPAGGTLPQGLQKTQGAQAGTAKIPGPGPGVMAVKRSSVESALGEAYVPAGDPRKAEGGGIKRAGVYKGGKTTPGSTKKGGVEAGPLKPERKPGESNADYQKRMLAYKKSTSEESMTEAEPQGRFAVLLTRESRGDQWAVSKSVENTPDNLQGLQQQADQTINQGGEDMAAAIFVTDSELAEIPDSGADVAEISDPVDGQIVSQHGMADEGIGAAIAKGGRVAADVAKGVGRAAGSIGGVAARGAGAVGKAVGKGVGAAGKDIEKSAAGKHKGEIEDDEDESHHETLQICPHCFVPMSMRLLAEGISVEQAKSILEQLPGEDEEEEDEEDADLSPELAGETPPDAGEMPPPEGDVGLPPPPEGEPPPVEEPPPPPPPAAGGPPPEGAPPEGAGSAEGVDGVPCPNCGQDVRQKLEVAGVLQNLAHEIYARAAGAAHGATAESQEDGLQAATNVSSRATQQQETLGEKQARLSTAWNENPDEFVEALVEGVVRNPDLTDKAANMVLGIVEQSFRDKDAEDAASILEELDEDVRAVRNRVMDIRLAKVGKIQSLVGSKYGRGTFIVQAQRMMDHLSEVEDSLTNFLTAVEKHKRQFERRYPGRLSTLQQPEMGTEPAPEMGGAEPEGPGNMAAAGEAPPPAPAPEEPAAEPMAAPR